MPCRPGRDFAACPGSGGLFVVWFGFLRMLCRLRSFRHVGILGCRREPDDIFGRRSLRALYHVELHPFTLHETAKSLPLNGREVNETVLSVVPRDKPKPLLIVKPLHRSLRTHVPDTPHVVCYGDVLRRPGHTMMGRLTDGASAICMTRLQQRGKRGQLSFC